MLEILYLFSCILKYHIDVTGGSDNQENSVIHKDMNFNLLSLNAETSNFRINMDTASCKFSGVAKYGWRRFMRTASDRDLLILSSNNIIAI